MSGTACQSVLDRLSQEKEKQARLQGYLACSVAILQLTFPFSIAGYKVYQETYFANVDENTQKPKRRHISRPCQPFWGHLAAIMNFAGGAAL